MGCSRPFIFHTSCILQLRMVCVTDNLAMEPASKRARKATSLKDKDAVCKVWKDARLESKPYFVTLTTKSLDGVLSYDTTSQKFSFKRLRFPVTHPLSSFEVQGLIFCRHQGVFNIHNGTWHAVPQAPEESKHRPAIGMMVDTAERPFSFKLVMGSVDKKTQIYDSKTGSWSTRASKVMQVAKSALNSPKPVACVCTKGCVYISIGGEILLVYSMEGDKWNILNSPKAKQEKGGCALGAWDGRIFTTREDVEENNLTLWELVDQTKQEWAEYAVMSKEPYDMVCGSQKNGMVCLLPCFCDGYLLIYNRQCFSAVVVLDLATKKWKQVDLGTEGGLEDEGEKSSEDEEEKSSDGEGEGSGDEGEGSEGEEGGSEDEDEGSEGKEGISDDGEDEEGFEDEQGEDNDDEEENGDGSDDNGGEEDDVDSSEDEDEE